MASSAASLWPWSAESTGDDDHVGDVEAGESTTADSAGRAHGRHEVPEGKPGSQGP